MLTKKQVFILAGVVLILAVSTLLVLVLYEYNSHTGPGEHEHQGDNIMTREDEIYLHSIIYEVGVSTFIRTQDTRTPHREVALRTAVVELHKKKRVATIKWLLEIVKEGKPRDARAAGITALALEEGPVYPLPFLDMPLESFDQTESNDILPTRKLLIIELEEILEKARKEARRDQ